MGIQGFIIEHILKDVFGAERQLLISDMQMTKMQSLASSGSLFNMGHGWLSGQLLNTMTDVKKVSGILREGTRGAPNPVLPWWRVR